MNISPNVLETLRLLRFTGIDICFNQITLYHDERRHGTRNLKKDLFLGHLQPHIDKSSNTLPDLSSLTVLFRAISRSHDEATDITGHPHI